MHFTYVAPENHLFGKILHISLVLISSQVLSSCEDVFEIRFQELSIAEIGESRIWDLFNFLVKVDIVFRKFVDKQSPEVATICDIGYLAYVIK